MSIRICLLLGISLLCTVTTHADQTLEELHRKFSPYPEKVDILAIVAHPDDEGYWGGLLAHYAIGQKKSVVLVSLTSGEWGNGLPHPVEPGSPPDCSYDDSDHPCFHKIPKDQLVYPCYYREVEMALAALEYGVQHRPVMPRWKDKGPLNPWGEPDAAYELWGGETKLVGYITSQIRKFQPSIVLGLAWHGGNGNPQHIAAGRATAKACSMAGDPKAFPEQIKEHAAWAPKKCYLHVGEGELHRNIHVHDWTQKLPGREETAQEVGARANALHESQDMKKECEPQTSFVLKWTTVGPDKILKDNLFENIAPQPEAP